MVAQGGFDGGLIQARIDCGICQGLGEHVA